MLDEERREGKQKRDIVEHKGVLYPRGGVGARPLAH